MHFGQNTPGRASSDVVDEPFSHPLVRAHLPRVHPRSERNSDNVRADGVSLGRAFLWHIRGPRDFEVALTRPGRSKGVVILQVRGSTAYVDEGRERVVEAGQLLIARARPREAAAICQEEDTKVLLVLPWSALIARHPTLSEGEQIYKPDDPGVRLLTDLLLGAVRDMHALRSNRRELLGSTLAHAVGLPQVVRQEERRPDRRVAEALGIIDAELQEPDLGAETLARSQRLGRRRLDQLFREELGVSVASYIASKRLLRAHELLVDPRHGKATITDIAFSVGFSDSGHFSRVFRARFGAPPSAVRQSGRPKV